MDVQEEKHTVTEGCRGGELGAEALRKVGLALARTKLGAAHPMAAESAVITPRAPMAPANTCTFMATRERGRERYI